MPTVSLQRNITKSLIPNTFFENAAVAHNLNEDGQASSRSRPLAVIQGGFPQQRG
jgi:hypothetical protein